MNLEEQRQHILSGKIYNDLTQELVEARERAVILTNQYNEAFGQSNEVREKILSELFESVGENPYLEPTFRCEFGSNISIGDNFYANFDCILLDGGGACYAKKVTIGDNVWVGAGVHINPGVTIGANSIIGSGSVVTKDIPENVIAVGVPCKEIRKIIEEDKTGFQF